MVAEEITETRVGAIGNVVTITGTPMKVGVYTATKGEQDDWVILQDFTEVKEVLSCYNVSAGARTVENFTIDAVEKNKVIFTDVSSGEISLVAIGV